MLFEIRRKTLSTLLRRIRGLANSSSSGSSGLGITCQLGTLLKTFISALLAQRTAIITVTKTTVIT